MNQEGEVVEVKCSKLLADFVKLKCNKHYKGTTERAEIEYISSKVADNIIKSQWLKTKLKNGAA